MKHNLNLKSRKYPKPNRYLNLHFGMGGITLRNQNYTMEFMVHYHEVNPKEQATPLTLLYYLEDAAIAHSESVEPFVRNVR